MLKEEKKRKEKKRKEKKRKEKERKGKEWKEKKRKEKKYFIFSSCSQFREFMFTESPTLSYTSTCEIPNPLSVPLLVKTLSFFYEILDQWIMLS